LRRKREVLLRVKGKGVISWRGKKKGINRMLKKPGTNLGLKNLRE